MIAHLQKGTRVAIASGLAGTGLGLAFSYALFSYAPPSSLPGVGIDVRETTLTGLRADSAMSALSPTERAVAVDWSRGRASLPLDYLARLELDGLEPTHHFPWETAADDAEIFILTEELVEILGLSGGESESIREVLLQARREHLSGGANHPQALVDEGDGVLMEFATASTDVEASIQSSIIGILGVERGNFLLSRIDVDLDWQFGRFGRARQFVKISILPDDTISIRQSLRSLDGGTELKVRQQRIAKLPLDLASLVVIKE